MDDLAFLASVPLLSKLPKADLERLVDMVTAVTYAEGDIIMAQGEKGDSMYILQEGKVAAEIGGTVVKEYEPTDFFGEGALVRDGNRRAATVKSVGASKCLRVGKQPFAIIQAGAGSLDAMMSASAAAGRSVAKTAKAAQITTTTTTTTDTLPDGSIREVTTTTVVKVTPPSSAAEVSRRARQRHAHVTVLHRLT